MRLTLLFLFISILCFGQKGEYFLTHYRPSSELIDNRNFDVVQDANGIVQIANRSGLLSYDGTNWDIINTPFALFTLSIDDNNIIYAGGRAGAGMFQETGGGGLRFRVFSEGNDNYFASAINKELVYFVSDRHVLVYNSSTTEIGFVPSTGHGDLLDISVVDNEVYVTTEEDGLMALVGENFVERSWGIDDQVYLVKSGEHSQVAYYTASGDFYVGNGDSAHKLNIDDEGYLDANMVIDMEWTNKTLLAIATLGGGVVFVNTETGLLEQIVNFRTGLPDNEVYAIGHDLDDGLWIAHPQGLSVAWASLPFKNYAHYPGLEGVMHDAIPHNKTIYVATSVGVYYLKEVREYKEVVTYKKSDGTKGDSGKTTDEDIQKKKKILGLFNRRKKSIESPPHSNEQNAQKNSGQQYNQSVSKELTSINYVYEPISGLNFKTIQLLEFNGRLLAATRLGVYEIINGSARQITEEPTLFMYAGVEDQLFVSTSNEQVLVFQINAKGEWVETKLLEGLNDYVQQIIEDKDNNIWLCGADSIYKISIKERDIDDVEVYPINNPYLEQTYTANFNDRVYFLNSTGYYYYENLKIVKDTVIENEIGIADRVLMGENGNLWLYSNNRWYGKDISIQKSLDFLSLFQNPVAIAGTLESKEFWVITSNNELYRVEGDKLEGISSKQNVFLKEIRNPDGKVSMSGSMNIEQVNNALTFEYTFPDYAGVYRIEYQYRLTGHTGQWSNWSASNNVITFPFLPPGDYTLDVRTRNVFNEITETDPLHFKIIPPYWKRWWFYLGELVFFGGLLFLSFSLGKKSDKYSVASRILALLTLILIAEFIQTIAESKFETNQSPVTNFFIQVCIAVFVLPLEAVLRRTILKSSAKPEKAVEE